MHLIETNHLRTWAASKAAESEFPHLIKSLIIAVVQPEKLRFPSGAAVYLPGFDGVVANSEQNRFVPTGLSVWELGTNIDFKGKANGDYKKRSIEKTKEIEDGKTATKLDRSQTTFVFVTPLVWGDKDKWVAERKAGGIWKDVIILDGVDIEEWIEAAPAVSLQFAADLGLVPPEGLQTLEQAWEDWSRRTKPPVSETLVLVDREDQEKELIARLTGPPSTFIIRGDSPREAWGFALAALRHVASEEDRLALCARSIVVDSDETVNRLLNLQNHIIVLKQVRGQVSGLLSSKGCHVIIPEGNDIHSQRNVIMLSRHSHHNFVEALKKMGLFEDDAERSARECGLSVTILQRQLALANFEKPKWAEGSSVTNLLPALLAGRWNDRNEADKEILRRLADSSSYDQVDSQLREYLSIDEPPLLKVAEMWTLAAPADIFQLIAHRLTAAHLKRFKDVFREVFGKIDPAVEIPPDERLFNRGNKDDSHSDWLRSGMAETLLLIAERGVDAKLDCGSLPRMFAEDVVKGLPDLNNDWRVLASIRDEYPRLMEAAPGPLLYSLERLLEAKPEDMKRLFAEGEGIFGGGPMHTGLLWGLETLAWGSEFLPRVAIILAKLASLDPGGRYMNRPINSLKEIFLWWLPGTNTPLGERLSVIDLILAREPSIGWELLAELLPNASPSVSHMTSKPRWRDFGDLPEDLTTRKGQARYVDEIVARALDRLGTDAERWGTILHSLRMVANDLQDKIISLLQDIAKGSESAAKRALWEKLRDFIYQHRTFHDANWALPKNLVDRLEAILPALAPSDLVERHRWLFDEWLPELPSGVDDVKQREKEVKRLREETAGDIAKTLGIDGLVKLGTICKLPGFVALAAVPLMANIDMVRDFVEKAIAAGEKGIYLAGQVSEQGLQLYKHEWRALVRKETRAKMWSPVTVATLLMLWPDEKSTWEEAKAYGHEIEMEYWRRKPVRLIDGSPDDKTYQIRRLIEARRASEAFDRVALKPQGIPTDMLLLLFDAAFDELAQAQTIEEIRRLGLNSYDVRQFLDELRNRTDIMREDVARREYRALPLLGSLDTRGLTIHEFMAEDPDFYVDILCEVFLPTNREKSEDQEPSPEVQARARVAYRLLEGMYQIPGQSEGNKIDEPTLVRWIDRVRKKAAERDRSAIADEQVGEILAHSPEDPEDKAWPHQVVRNVIENRVSSDLERGLIIERHNMRGAYSKALFEGGDQERKLAMQYRAWSKSALASWPKVSMILAAIAESWEELARREDEVAEQRKLE